MKKVTLMVGVLSLYAAVVMGMPTSFCPQTTKCLNSGCSFYMPEGLGFVNYLKPDWRHQTKDGTYPLTSVTIEREGGHSRVTCDYWTARWGWRSDRDLPLYFLATEDTEWGAESKDRYLTPRMHCMPGNIRGGRCEFYHN